MFKADIGSDLFEAGVTEEGFPIIGPLYYVIIENAKGRRFRHFMNFKGIRVDADEYGMVYASNVHNEAIVKVLDLAKKVNEALVMGLKLDEERWTEIDPAYGSAEYISQGIEEQHWMMENESY